jgi:hypothetical protein
MANKITAAASVVGSLSAIIKHLEVRRNQHPRLKRTDEAWNSIKGQLEKR